MNTLVGGFVTLVVLYFMWKVLGPSVSLPKRGKKRKVRRRGYHPRDPKLEALSKLRGQERRLRAELRKIQEEIKDTAMS